MSAKKGSSNDSWDEQSDSDGYYPEDFKPRDTDVIVGKGLNCYNHFGNKMLRDIVVSRLEDYAATTRKKEKSIVLSSIVAQVRQVGEFIQKDLGNGLWYKADNFLARDKVSQTLRNILSEQKGKERDKKRKGNSNDDIGSKKAASKRKRNSAEESKSETTILNPDDSNATKQNEDLGTPTPSNTQEMKSFDEEDSLETIDYQDDLQEIHWSNNDPSLSSSIISTDFDNFLQRYASCLSNECFEDQDPYEPNPLA